MKKIIITLILAMPVLGHAADQTELVTEMVDLTYLACALQLLECNFPDSTRTILEFKGYKTPKDISSYIKKESSELARDILLKTIDLKGANLDALNELTKNNFRDEFYKLPIHCAKSIIEILPENNGQIAFKHVQSAFKSLVKRPLSKNKTLSTKDCDVYDLDAYDNTFSAESIDFYIKEKYKILWSGKN